jgi:hypothetical protein
MRESTSRNQMNGSTPERLHDAIKLRNTAAVLPPWSRANHRDNWKILAPHGRLGNNENWLTALQGSGVSALEWRFWACTRAISHRSC